MKNFLISTAISLFFLAGISCTSEAKAKGNDNEKSDSGVIYLNKDTFKEKVFNYETNKEWKYEGNAPAILDFYADWCGPCRMLAPVLNDIQKEYNGKVQIFKVDTDKEKELAGIFGIRSLPTIVFIPVDGQPQAVMGFRPKEDMEKIILEVLKVSK
ncbi:thioredoxin [Plebeiibacterium sediminum]|uniref:Thioredoxin n=1 Tax=Plebeiibacterium sediminum TaxID=2992112 RepID=A0AAE3M1N5_9BACT|nr:thioredoxin [Plebeiobacterium sediminum]MCW3785651.1 thioredoxin [Plebeiobacterium sediminum]